MNPKKFLTWAGWLLVAVGVLGYLIGDLWSPLWVFGGNENIAHIIVGAVMLAAVYWGKTKSLFDWLTIAVGVLALFFAAYGWFVSGSFQGLADFEQLDNVVHLVIGAWAFWAVWGQRGRR